MTDFDLKKTQINLNQISIGDCNFIDCNTQIFSNSAISMLHTWTAPHANATRQGFSHLYQSRSSRFVGVGSSPSSSVGLSRHRSYDCRSSSSSKRTSHPSRLSFQKQKQIHPWLVIVVRSNSPINQVLEICLCVGELPAIIWRRISTPFHPLRARLLGFTLDKRRPPHGQNRWEWASLKGTFMNHATSIRKNKKKSQIYV